MARLRPVSAASRFTEGPASRPGECRECGCTDDHACLTPLGPCYWVTPQRDLCSACVGAVVAAQSERLKELEARLEKFEATLAQPRARRAAPRGRQ